MQCNLRRDQINFKGYGQNDKKKAHADERNKNKNMNSQRKYESPNHFPCFSSSNVCLDYASFYTLVKLKSILDGCWYAIVACIM